MKVAICVPHYGDTRAEFALSLARMIYKSAGRDLEVFMTSSSSVTGNRRVLVRRARDWSADWILWLDSDQSFPPETLERLLGHNLPAVGCNYARRDGRNPVAVDETGKQLVFTTEAKARGNLLEPVSSTGLGVFLVSMAAIDRLDEEPFDLFAEDVSFFGRLRASGTTPYIDHTLSWLVGHVMTTVATNASIQPSNGETGLNAHSLSPPSGVE